MSLSDYFPEEIQNNYKERALKVGAVLKLFVSGCSEILLYSKHKLLL